MFEFIIVMLVVAIAAYFTARQLIGQLKGKGCNNCAGHCGLANRNLEELVKTDE